MKILYIVEVDLLRLTKGYDPTIKPGSMGSVIRKAKKAKPLKLTPLTSAYYNIEAHICLFAEDAQEAKNLAAEIVKTSRFWLSRHGSVRSDSFPHLNPNWWVKPDYEFPNPPGFQPVTPQKIDLLQALEALIHDYVLIVNSGDCGFGDAESEAVVINARAAIKQAKQV